MMEANTVVETPAEAVTESTLPAPVVVEGPENDGEQTFIFTLTFRGKESQTDPLTMKQIRSRLQILRSYQENEQEFWKDKNTVAPYAEIVNSAEFDNFMENHAEVLKDRLPESGRKRILKLLERRFREIGGIKSAASLILFRKMHPKDPH